MFRGALCNPADDSPLPAMFGVNPLGVTFFSVGGREVGLGGEGESRRCSLRVGAPPPLRPAATPRLPPNKIGHAVSAPIK